MPHALAHDAEIQGGRQNGVAQPQTRTVSTQRVVFVDGLRGLAALWVVAYHLATHRLFSPPLDGVLGAFQRVAEYGYLGVPVFFVISGFAVAASIGTDRISVKYYFSFVARRLVRLTPPYWATIAFVVATTAVARALVKDYDHALPSVGSVLAHMFYLYPLFGYEPILAIFWTLIPIVQFYIVFTAILGVVQVAWPSKTLSQTGVLLLVVLPAIVSAWFPPAIPWLYTASWYMFCTGALLYWWHRGSLSWHIFAFVTLAIAASLLWRFSLYKLATVCAVLTIVFVSSQGKTNAWLGGALVAFFARISYSLYLIHGTIGWRVLSLGERLTGKELCYSLMWLVLAIAASVLAAIMMYRWIELPAMRFSRRIRHS